ncbi:MAG: hypothetical protein WA592_19680, partial [Pseudolabrys sp.]
WFCVLRSIVFGVVGVSLTAPFFLRQAMNIDHELVLVSARKSRRSNHWGNDDYDVRRVHTRGPVVEAFSGQPWRRLRPPGSGRSSD